MDTVTNVQLANVTHSNVLTVTNILTLQQDHYYTVIASFSNVGGDFTTDSIATLSKTLLLLYYYIVLNDCCRYIWCSISQYN